MTSPLSVMWCWRWSWPCRPCASESGNSCGVLTLWTITLLPLPVYSLSPEKSLTLWVQGCTHLGFFFFKKKKTGEKKHCFIIKGNHSQENLENGKKENKNTHNLNHNVNVHVAVSADVQLRPPAWWQATPLPSREGFLFGVCTCVCVCVSSSLHSRCWCFLLFIFHFFGLVLLRFLPGKVL